jgi:hypothetical protein
MAARPVAPLRFRVDELRRVAKARHRQRLWTTRFGVASGYSRRRDASKTDKIPGRNRRSCSERQAGISLHANKTLAQDEPQVSLLLRLH